MATTTTASDVRRLDDVVAAVSPIHQGFAPARATQPHTKLVTTSVLLRERDDPVSFAAAARAPAPVVPAADPAAGASRGRDLLATSFGAATLTTEYGRGHGVSAAEASAGWVVLAFAAA